MEHVHAYYYGACAHTDCTPRGHGGDTAGPHRGMCRIKGRANELWRVAYVCTYAHRAEVLIKKQEAGDEEENKGKAKRFI